MNKIWFLKNGGKKEEKLIIVSIDKLMNIYDFKKLFLYYDTRFIKVTLELVVTHRIFSSYQVISRLLLRLLIHLLLLTNKSSVYYHNLKALPYSIRRQAFSSIGSRSRYTGRKQFLKNLSCHSFFWKYRFTLREPKYIWNNYTVWR